MSICELADIGSHTYMVFRRYGAIGYTNLQRGRHWKPHQYGLPKDMGAIYFVNLTFQAHHEYNWEPRSNQVQLAMSITSDID